MEDADDETNSLPKQTLSWSERFAKITRLISQIALCGPIIMISRFLFIMHVHSLSMVPNWIALSVLRISLICCKLSAVFCVALFLMELTYYLRNGSVSKQLLRDIAASIFLNLCTLTGWWIDVMFVERPHTVGGYGS
jgi:hypothetical protein